MAYKPAVLAAVDGGTGQSSYTTGDLLYASSSTALSKLALGSAGQILSLSGGVPAWVTYSSIIDYIDAVLVATTASLNATYVNGVAGVGATLINAGALAAFSVDGQTPAINSRVLVKNQGSTFQNGVYTLTTVGSGAIAWILTRSTDYNTPSEINVGDVIPVQTGTANANTSWLQGATVTTIGTDPITFTQFQSAPISTTQYDVLVGGANNSVASVGPGTAGQVLQSGGNAANPAYSTATYPATSGTSGNVLASDGTNWISQANNITGNLVKISSQTITSAASVTQVSFNITTTYNTYQLIITNCQPATNAALLRMLFTNNGGQIVAGYTSGITTNTYNLTTMANTNSTTFIPLCAAQSSTNSYGLSGSLYLYNMNLTSPASACNWVIGHAYYVNSTPALANAIIYGSCSISAVVTSIQLVYSAGNINNGVFTLYGINET